MPQASLRRFDGDFLVVIEVVFVEILIWIEILIGIEKKTAHLIATAIFQVLAEAVGAKMQYYCSLLGETDGGSRPANGFA